MARRQARGISIQDAAFISEAGRNKVTETIGKEVGGLGAVLSEAFKKASDAKAVKTEEAAKAAEASFKNQADGAGAKLNSKNYFEGFGDSDLSITGSISPSNLPFVSTPTDEQKAEVKKQGGGGLPSWEDAWNLNISNIQNIYTDFDAYKAAMKGMSPEQTAENEAKRTWAKNNLGENVDYNEDIHGKQYQASVANTMAPRMKDDTPFDRRSSNQLFANNQLLSGLQNQSVKGSSDNSQFTPGRTFVAKERMLSAPSWMGSAAIEGWNMGVAERNYEKQVQADTQDFYNQELKGLDVGRTGYNFLDDSITEMARQKRNDFVAHQKQKDQWFSEGRENEWYNKNEELKNFSNSVLNAKDGISNVLNQYAQGLKDETIDPNFNIEGQDLLNSILSGKAPIGIADIGDGAALIGSTNRNEPVNLSLSSIQDALSKIKLVQKQEPMEFYNAFLGDLKENKIPGVEKSVQLLPNGNKVSTYNTSQLNMVIDTYIKEELKSVQEAKGYGSALLGMNQGHWNAMVEAGEDPKAVIADKMRNDLNSLMAPMLGYKSEETTGLSTALANEQIKIREEQRGKDSANTGVSNIDNLVRAEKGVRLEGGGIVYDGKSGPVLVNNRKTFFTAFPEIKKLEGKGGIEEIKVEDGQITIFRQKKDPMTFLLSEGIETVQQNLRNIAEDVKYKGTPSLKGAPHLNN